MKKYLIIGTLSAVLLIVIALTLVFQDRAKGPPIEDGNRSQQLGLYFQGMGISEVPSIPITSGIVLPDMNGNNVRLSEYKGRIVFLNFWATWCPPCREEMPSMERLHNRLKGKDFVMLAVDLQEPVTRVRKFFRDHKLTFTALLDEDGKVAQMFGIRNIPTTFILDREHRVIGMAVGARQWDNRHSLRMFEYLLDHEGVVASSP
ncbi:MAG: TlpA family protein disulfide reductase [Deltaproteobacteria bacterium]|nr:TlpA family protein disulfide reductase [Deltaproteobacteria bacterium]